MRGARLFILAFASIAGCSAPPAPVPKVADPSIDAPRPNPGFKLDFPDKASVTDPAPGGGASTEAPPPPPAGVARTAAEIPLRKEPAAEDVLKLQKDVAARHPASDDEKLRLALLHAASGNLEEAERVLSTVRSRANRLVPYVEFYLRRQLGDHKEAGKLLAKFADEERAVTGFVIDRAELGQRVRRFRHYTPA